MRRYRGRGRGRGGCGRATLLLDPPPIVSKMKESPLPNTCSYCKKAGHALSDCRVLVQQKCWFCNEVGHTIDQCFYGVPEPAFDYCVQKLTKEQPIRIVAHVLQQTISNPNDHTSLTVISEILTARPGLRSTLLNARTMLAMAHVRNSEWRETLLRKFLPMIRDTNRAIFNGFVHHMMVNCWLSPEAREDKTKRKKARDFRSVLAILFSYGLLLPGKSKMLSDAHGPFFMNLLRENCRQLLERDLRLLPIDSLPLPPVLVHLITTFDLGSVIL